MAGGKEREKDTEMGTEPRRTRKSKKGKKEPEENVKGFTGAKLFGRGAAHGGSGPAGRTGIVLSEEVIAKNDKGKGGRRGWSRSEEEEGVM